MAPTTWTIGCPTSFTVRTNGVVVRRVDQDLAGGAICVEISVWRNPHKQRAATYQGDVELVDGRWVANAISHTRTGEHRTTPGSYRDFADAENILVRHRSGHRSAVTWTGPRPVCRNLTCTDCAATLRSNEARRTGLRWTPPVPASPRALAAARDARSDYYTNAA